MKWHLAHVPLVTRMMQSTFLKIAPFKTHVYRHINFFAAEEFDHTKLNIRGKRNLRDCILIDCRQTDHTQPKCIAGEHCTGAIF